MQTATASVPRTQALSAAIVRVGRFPRPKNRVMRASESEAGYDDDPYVDCPYDDYQDYEDAPDP